MSRIYFEGVQLVFEGVLIQWLKNRIYTGVKLLFCVYLLISLPESMSDGFDRWTRPIEVCPCRSVHVSGRVCPGSAGSRSRPSDMDSGKPIFLSGAPRPASSSLRGLSSQAVTLLRGAKFIAWCLRHRFLGEFQRDPRNFWNCQTCLAYGSRPGSTLKGPVHQSSGWWDVR